MCPAGEALGVGVRADNDERDGREIKGKRVQHPCREKEQSRGSDGEPEDEAASEQAGGNCADRSARIECVDIGVNKAVESHGGRARRDHCYADPCQGAERRNSVGGDDGAGEAKGEREEGMLPFDHVESDANVVKYATQHLLRTQRESNHELLYLLL